MKLKIRICSLNTFTYSVYLVMYVNLVVVALSIYDICLTVIVISSLDTTNTSTISTVANLLFPYLL